MQVLAWMHVVVIFNQNGIRMYMRQVLYISIFTMILYFRENISYPSIYIYISISCFRATTCAYRYMHIWPK